MIIDTRHCSYPASNVAVNKKGLCCKQHAANGIVDVFNQTCPHTFCTSQASFNIPGTKNLAYSTTNVHDNMINVVSRRCSHDVWPEFPTFNAAGIIKACFRKQHVENGMVAIKTTFISMPRV